MQHPLAAYLSRALSIPSVVRYKHIVILEMQGVNGSAVNAESYFVKTGGKTILEIGRERFRIKDHVLLTEVKDATSDYETPNSY